MNKLSTEQLKQLRALCNDSTVWASVLDELIAIRDLKGDHVPVVIHDYGEASVIFGALKDNKISDYVINPDLGPMGATQVEEWTSKIGGMLTMHIGMGGGSLFITASKKPVVLPKKVVRNPQFNAGIEACRKAIEAAGGSIKDPGEII